jgi:bud site selection protein 31
VEVACGCVLLQRGLVATGDGRFGGPIWWNTPLHEEDEDADEDAHRAQWEQDTGGQEAPGPPNGAAGMAKRARDAAEEEQGLPDEVQARLKALRGD